LAEVVGKRVAGDVCELAVTNYPSGEDAPEDYDRPELWCFSTAAAGPLIAHLTCERCDA
jgi:hypothetical protein